MPVIIDHIDPLWHEELLTLYLLRQGNCDKTELKKRIRYDQQTRLNFYPPNSHSNSAYDYWFRALKKRCLIVEYDRTLSLTDLGRWVVEGKVGGIPERNQFVANFICEECSSPDNIVLYIPLMNTMETNSKGAPFVNIHCHICGKLLQRCNMSGIAQASGFVQFYNQAVFELKKFVKNLVACTL